MPSDLQVDNIKDGSATKTLATLSSSAVTLHSDVTFPKGVSRGVNFLHQVQSSGTTLGGTLGGTGTQIVPFNTIKAGTQDSAFTQDILSLGSNQWSMRTGYYLWDFYRATFDANHIWVLGIQTYGDNTGSGTTVGNITTDNVNFGSSFYYTHPSASHAIPTIVNGVLKVTHTAQKYVFRMIVEVDNQHGTNTYTHSSNFHNIQHSLRFIRIGDV
tara:strand:- start:132 stop:773 length:642 start_codon:yes stop_codon:yes gene_type:complete